MVVNRSLLQSRDTHSHDAISLSQPSAHPLLPSDPLPCTYGLDREAHAVIGGVPSMSVIAGDLHFSVGVSRFSRDL